MLTVKTRRIRRRKLKQGRAETVEKRDGNIVRQSRNACPSEHNTFLISEILKGRARQQNYCRKFDRKQLCAVLSPVGTVFVDKYIYIIVEMLCNYEIVFFFLFFRLFLITLNCQKKLSSRSRRLTETSADQIVFHYEVLKSARTTRTLMQKIEFPSRIQTRISTKTYTSIEKSTVFIITTS